MGRADIFDDVRETELADRLFAKYMCLFKGGVLGTNMYHQNISKFLRLELQTWGHFH